MHQPSLEPAAAAPLDVHAVATAWSVEPALVLGLAVTAVVYARGRRVLARRRAAGVERWRAAAFLAGLAALFLALASPLDMLSDRFLAVHMAQHLVLLAVVPPLLLLGAPLLPLLSGLPIRRVRRAVAKAVVRVVHRVGHPVLCWLAMALATWAWHVPAAFELALSYARERVQGGLPILEHQHVKLKLFEMFLKIEAARSLNRRVLLYNTVNNPFTGAGNGAFPAVQYAVASKVTSTQTAFEVATEALQVFGGNGLSHEYPIEKLLRHARASLIEDGCNEVLAIHAAEKF